MKNFSFAPLLALIFVAQLAFVIGFVANEHTLYFWDHAMYHNMAKNLWVNGYPAFARSLSQDYTYIFALPSLIGFWLFKDSRLVFILSNFLAFFVLYEIAVSFVLRQIFEFPWKKALFAGFGVCSLIPPLWMPLLDGYPDISATACLVFSVGLFLGKNRNWRTALGTGILLALSILLRRHYAYPVLALLLTASAHDFFRLFIKTDKEERKNAFLRFIKFFGLSGLVLLGTIYIIAPDFLISAVSTDYISLYASYSRPALEFLYFAIVSFGSLLVIASIAGLFLSKAKWKQIAFVAVFSLVCLILWCIGSCQVSRHYMLHVLPLMAVIGITGLFDYLYRSRKQGRAIAVMLLIVFAANSVWALWLSPEETLPNNNGTLALYSAPRPPEVRQDYNELVRLANYLATTTKSNDKIFVVGSSFNFNQNLISAALIDAAGKGSVVSRFIWGPEIDGEQDPPFDAFASATIYVVPTPPQYHLSPEGQKVITASAKQFPPFGAKAGLFHKDENIFSLENGVKVEIWRRDKWTPGLLFSTMDSIKSLAGGQREWIVTNAPFQKPATRFKNGVTIIFDSFDKERRSLDAFFNGPITNGNYRLGVDTDSQKDCRDVRFILYALNSTGKQLWQLPFAPVLLPGRVFQPFSLDVPANEPAFLMLHMETNPLNPCTVLLTSLRIESM